MDATAGGGNTRGGNRPNSPTSSTRRSKKLSGRDPQYHQIKETEKKNNKFNSSRATVTSPFWVKT